MADSPDIQQLTDSNFDSTINGGKPRSEEHTSELQSQSNLVCRLLLEKKKKRIRVRANHVMAPIYAITLYTDNTRDDTERISPAYCPSNTHTNLISHSDYMRT